MYFLSAFALLQVVAVASAQSSAQYACAAAYAAQIPDCVKSCDDAAITQVGCNLTDYACHCAHGSQLATIIPPCLQNSTCSSADLALFGTIPGAICAALNGTSCNATTTTATSATAKPSSSASYSSISTKGPPPIYTTTASASAAASASSSESPATVTTNAAVSNGVRTGVFAGVGFGLFAVLL